MTVMLQNCAQAKQIQAQGCSVILFDQDATIDAMRQQVAVVVDMALSEGGNVEGSAHDQSHLLGNGVLATNMSGYPQVLPITTGALPLKPC